HAQPRRPALRPVPQQPDGRERAQLQHRRDPGLRRARGPVLPGRVPDARQERIPGDVIMTRPHLPKRLVSAAAALFLSAAGAGAATVASSTAANAAAGCTAAYSE